MKKYFQLVLVISMSLLTLSCYYDEVIEFQVPLPENVSFQNDIQPLFDQSCVTCHDGNLEPDLRDFNAYNSLINGYVVPGDAEGSILYMSLINSNGVSLMPPEGQWPDSKINLVLSWIDEGALDN